MGELSARVAHDLRNPLGGTISISNNPTVFTVKLPKNSRIKQE